MRLLTVDSCAPLAKMLAQHSSIGSILSLVQAFAQVQTCASYCRVQLSLSFTSALSSGLHTPLTGGCFYSALWLGRTVQGWLHSLKPVLTLTAT